MRPLLKIQEGYNPKGLGLFLWAYAKLYKLDKRSEYLEKIETLLHLLRECSTDGYRGNCWGYNFDWQSRAFYLPKYTPTIVNTSFIGHALIDTYNYTGIEDAREMAIEIKDFILKDLNRKDESFGVCFSYTPLDEVYVHNANLLGASLLIRLNRFTNDGSLVEAALSSLAYSMHYQREDGAWFYAETDYQKWIDSFHTGFNLQSILYFLEEGFGGEYEEALNQGTVFYRDNFFSQDGTPKYFHNRIYPIDVHSAAEAIVFFCRMGEGYRELVSKLVNWMLVNFQHPKGYFYYQKRRMYINKIPYIRWGQAWAFHALTEYMISTDGED